MDIVTYALLKKYVQDTVEGAGGFQGEPGKSAYEIALDNGLVPKYDPEDPRYDPGVDNYYTESEWIEWLTHPNWNNITNKPTIPAAQVQSDWNASSGMGVILNKPTNVSSFTNDAGYLTEHQSLTAYAPLASPAFTGNPTATTQSTGNNSTRIATTAYVKNNLSSYAPLASPALIGTPTAPTPDGNNLAQIVTVEYVSKLNSISNDDIDNLLSDIDLT